MRLVIRHSTAHLYARALCGLAQLIRLTPRDGDAQRVRSWTVSDDAGREPASYVDAFGNRTHFHTRSEGRSEVSVTAVGEVETKDTGGRISGDHEPLPPAFFLRSTALTAPQAILCALAADARGRAAGGEGPCGELLTLAALIRERIPHRPSVTTVATSAAEALESVAGVCQDRAHVFLAAARALGHPARYVSGYLYDAANEDAQAATHAWVEAWTAATGWIGLDPSTGTPVGEQHVRVAIGLDYTEAAPLRGVRNGGALERLAVHVQVREAAQQ
jgi:transglutaminase-like putative cysteine protease